METIYLVGTEQIQNAASSMRQAAHEMQSAAAEIQSAFEMHQRWADQWLADFRDIMEKSVKETDRG